MHVKNERGLSLIEVLASFILISIILVLVFSIVVSSQKQNIDQTKEATQINDASYVLKILTKDIRNTNQVNVIGTTKYELILHDGMHPIVYEFKNNELYRSDQVLANNIERFSMQHVITATFLNIAFTMNEQDYHASLSYRKGSN